MASASLAGEFVLPVELEATEPPEARGMARDAVRLLERRRMAEHDDDGAGAGAEIGWAVQVAPVDEWLAVSRRQLAAVRDALAAGGGSRG